MTFTATLFIGLVLAGFFGFAVMALFVTISDALYDRRSAQPYATGRKAAEAHGAMGHA